MAEVFIQWDPNRLTTQVKEMDDEHIHLINLMNELYGAHMEKKSFEEQTTILVKLVKYAETHFRSEEKFFSTLPYAQAEVHKKIHADLILRLKEFGEKFKNEKKLNNDFFTFLKVWLSAHIMGIDAKYGQVAVQMKKQA